jgi:hypothetical protein
MQHFSSSEYSVNRIKFRIKFYFFRLHGQAMCLIDIWSLAVSILKFNQCAFQQVNFMIWIIYMSFKSACRQFLLLSVSLDHSDNKPLYDLSTEKDTTRMHNTATLCPSDLVRPIFFHVRRDLKTHQKSCL